MDFSEFLQPAIYGLTGKPGAGKSYFATRLIIAEITKGKNRPIVSNVPINKKKLREYVKKDFYYYDLETYTDNKAFFTNRGYYHIDVNDLGSNVDFAPLLKEDDEGVLFIIDEAHLYFNARNWKHMPQATISYITTIRHVGDSLIWMCQKFSDIDSQIRGKTQAFHLLRNLAKEKLGIFKRGTGFRCYQYLDEHHISNHGSITAQVAQDFSYPFELKIAECYSTSLFNKSHDKRYKVKGLPLKYLIYAIVLFFLGFLGWMLNGGFSSITQSLIPDMAQVSSSQNYEDFNKSNDPNIFTQVNTFTRPLPSQDPFEDINATIREIPIHIFGTTDKVAEPFSKFTDEDYDHRVKYWFGNNRKCKLVFIADKETKERNTGFNFASTWNEFAKLNQIDLSKESGVWMVQTPYFLAFLDFVRDTGRGSNLKEIDFTLKENIPCQIEHGFQLPVESSVATQGVIRTQKEYKDVGFMLDLIFQSIEDKELLKIDLENSDVMDMTSDYPVLQTFRSKNTLDVKDGMTYQIADFKSTTAQQSKGIFRSQSYETIITNKLFIVYGG